jgi:hypothetical protein
MSRGYLREYGLVGLSWWQDFALSSCVSWRPSGTLGIRKSGSRHLFAASVRTRLLAPPCDDPSRGVVAAFSARSFCEESLGHHLGPARLCSTNGAKCAAEAALGAPELSLGFMDCHDYVVSIDPTERLGKSADALSIAGDTVGNRREFGSGAFEGIGHTSRLPTGHTVPGTM